MADKMSLSELKKAIASERKKYGSAQERKKLEAELAELRESNSSKLAKRLGRGFIELTKQGAKAAGSGIKKMNKFAVESGAADGMKFDFNRPSYSSGRSRKKNKRKYLEEYSLGFTSF